jgi:hypothetical protein
MRDSVTGAREFLRSPEGEHPDDYVVNMIEQHLPANWQGLIREYGHAKVFECLRCGLTIGGAKYHCIMDTKPVPVEMVLR